MDQALERKHWAPATQERAVERFYSHGAESFGEFHGGYLNFGLWEEGISDYLAAAENLVHRLGEFLGLKPGSRLVDVGCGMGPQDVYLFRKFGPIEIDAVDITWKHIELGRRRVRLAGCDGHVRFLHGSAVDLPFADQTFTSAMSIEGTIHFYTRERFLLETLRVLKPGGVVAIADYTIKRTPRNAFERALLRLARRLWRIPLENVVTAEAYRRTLTRLGFVNVSLQEVGALTYPGYYFEQRRCLPELARIRGFVAGRLGHLIDLVAYKAYTSGLVDYVLVRAEKPA